MLETLHISERLNETAALQLAADLSLLDLNRGIELDFSHTRHFEPFAMLLVASSVNRLKERAARFDQQLIIRQSGIDPEGIAAHMGFWQAMGLNIGRPVGSAAGKDTYLPITKIAVSEIYAESGGANPLAGGVIEKRARELAGVLGQTGNDELLECLTYAFRELIRNVIEHAMTPDIWIAGMSWPKRDYIQVAILDEGRGIRKSLADHAQFKFDRDLDALRRSLEPGVSRNLGRVATPAELDRWADERHAMPREVFMNSGYGLHMISELCKDAGQFLIASFAAYLAYVSSAEIQGSTGHHGTAIRLVLRPSEVPHAWARLFERMGGDSQTGRNALISASKLKRLGLDSLVGGANDPPGKP